MLSRKMVQYIEMKYSNSLQDSSAPKALHKGFGVGGGLAA